MNPADAFGLYAILGESIDPTPGYVNVTLPATLDPRYEAPETMTLMRKTNFVHSKQYILKAVKPE